MSQIVSGIARRSSRSLNVFPFDANEYLVSSRNSDGRLVIGELGCVNIDDHDIEW